MALNKPQQFFVGARVKAIQSGEMGTIVRCIKKQGKKRNRWVVRWDSNGYESSRINSGDHVVISQELESTMPQKPKRLRFTESQDGRKRCEVSVSMRLTHSEVQALGKVAEEIYGTKLDLPVHLQWIFETAVYSAIEKCSKSDDIV